MVIEEERTEENCWSIKDFGGKIHSEKEYSKESIKTLGIGYGSWKTHAYFTERIKYESLTREEKKKYNDRETCKLIRTDYNQLIKYDDGSSSKIIVKFYYNANEVFFVTYQENSVKKNKFENSIYHNFFIINIETEFSENKQLKDWLIDKNSEIIKVWSN